MQYTFTLQLGRINLKISRSGFEEAEVLQKINVTED